MKFKLLASSVLMAGALMGSGTASAIVFATGTYNDWVGATMTLFGGATQVGSTVTDADGDMTLTAASALTGDLIGHGDLIAVTLAEVEVNGVDLYTVSFDFHGFNGGDGYNGTGGNIEYSLTSLAPDEWIASARLDTDVTGGLATTIVTKDLYDNPDFTNGHFLQLTSINGQQDPLVGHASFDARQTVYVKDTLTGGGAYITHVDNQFDVPEPTTMIMLGLGLAAFGYSRRGAKGLSA